MENSNTNLFLAHFLTFVTQGITWVLFPFYEEITDNGTFKTNTEKEFLNQFHDFNIVPIIFIDYINECWEKCNKENKKIWKYKT